jgi:hypothetical protein
MLLYSIPKRTLFLIHFFVTVYLIRYHTQNSEKIFAFWLIFWIWCFRQPSNLAFVVTLWRQAVTWKSGCFSASERGDFLKDSGILQLSLIKK